MTKAMLFFIVLTTAIVYAVTTDAQERSPAQAGTSDGKSILRTKKITHPGTKDGLFLIDEDGVYHYKVEGISKGDHSMFMRFISVSSPDITAEVGGDTLGYNDFYSGAQQTGLDFIYEWQPFKNFGKAGVQFGVGLTISNGRGQFVNPPTADPDAQPLEKYTLFSVPLSLGVIYRFEYMRRQWFVPYVSGGLSYFGLVEYRDDGDMKAVGSPAAYGAGGVLVNITALNRDLAFIMDREYGFSSLWLTAEFRYNQGFNEDLDVTSDQISVGLGVDY